MKAAQINAYGDISVVFVNPNAPDPLVKPDQVLVDIHAASFNPFDAFVRAGYMKDRMPLPFPITIGGDFAGVIRQTGQEVYGSAHVANGGSGSFAEVASVNQINLATKPKNVSFEEAAALPLVGASTVQALEEHMKLAKGQKILIHGGAGGIGHIAIQLAKHIGAFVATTVRTDHVDFVRTLGADEITDFTKEDFSMKRKDFDAVFDMVGGEVLTKSELVVKPTGIIVSMVGQPKKGITQSTKTNTEHLDRVAELVNAGTIRVHVDKIFPIDQIQEAWKYKEQGHPIGKVVVKL